MNDELRFRSLVSVLLVEALGGITFGIVTLASREFLGELVPLWIPAASVAFGLACLTAAAGLTRRSTWARGLTVGLQAVTVASGVLGFVYSSQPVLLAAILLGGSGLWLLRRGCNGRRSTNRVEEPTGIHIQPIPNSISVENPPDSPPP